MPPQSALAFQGTICHTPTIGSVEVLQDHLLVVNSTGSITHLGPANTSDAAAALQQVALQPNDIHTLNPTQFLLPGFIDTHCHAPQYAFTGTGTDLALFEWLNTYTFPCEAKFGDRQHAEFVYSRLVQRLLRLGTTTSNYFTTTHVKGCKVLADTVVKLGQRAVLGKVCMDQHSPENYVDQGTQESLQGAREVVQYIQGLDCERVVPSVVPRFIPTCSQELLSGLGDLAQAEGLVVHSHISESRDQVKFSQQLHPGARDDAAIYDAAGLLTSRSIFAHGTQLTSQALQLMANRGAAIAHCPLSNFMFGDGLLCVARALAHGVKVGLGTDVAGGYSPSMLQAMRLAVINSHALKAATLMAPQQQELPQEEQQPVKAQQGGAGDQQLQHQQQQQPGAVRQQDEGSQQLQHEQEAVAQQPHGAAAGLAGSKVAAAINSPEVSAAAMQHQLSWEDALYLATAGGAAALGLDSVVGHFAVGMAFDALLVDCGLPEVFDVLQGQDEPLVLLEHFVSNGDDRNITGVWVQGRLCKPA